MQIYSLGNLKRIYIVTITICILGIPFIPKSDYILHVGIMIGINIILALGMRLILLIDQVSLAHAGFMAIGAYASAMLTINAHWPFWLALPGAGLVAVTIAILFGYPTLRVKGAYFFITSFAFTEIILLTATHWIEPFGGPTGITNVPRPNPLNLFNFVKIQFVSETSNFYLILIFVLITIWVMYRIDKSYFGLTIRAIGQMDILAQSIGINIMRVKVIVFTVGCFFAAIAGSFYTHYSSYVGPDNFSSPLGLNILVYAILGGSKSILGPLIGTIVFTILPEVTRIAVYYEPLFFGAALILAILFLPDGLVTLPTVLKTLGKKNKSIHISGD